MIEIKPPNNPILSGIYRPSIFLAGSIEQDKAERWQADMVERFNDHNHLIIYNPRRDDWDPNLPQEQFHTVFDEQVMWELDKLEKATVIPMYFQPGTLSPITLLELGLFADSGKLIVCCPEGYWRKGNVDIVCREWNIETVDTKDELVEATAERISNAKSPKAGLPPAKLT
jgi:hypothetical protein